MAATAETLAPVALAQGDTAPACTLPLTGGQTVELASFRNKKNVVLYFYPRDDTPGCTTEAKDFRDLKAEFDATDTVIIGISKDDLKSHDKFRAKFDLPFDLAADTDTSICAAYGVWVEKSMYGKKYMGINRATFLIDKKGNIAKVWPKVSVTSHAADVLKAVHASKRVTTL